MSTRNIADELLALLALVNLDSPRDEPLGVDDLEVFSASITGAGSVEFTVPSGKCAVVVALEDFNADPAAAHTISVSAEGKVASEVQPADWRLGGDVFYVFPPGISRFTFVATALAGTTFQARAVGYMLPVSALQRLSRLSTRVIG